MFWTGASSLKRTEGFRSEVNPSEDTVSLLSLFYALTLSPVSLLRSHSLSCLSFTLSLSLLSLLFALTLSRLSFTISLSLFYALALSPVSLLHSYSHSCLSFFALTLPLATEEQEHGRLYNCLFHTHAY